MQRIHTLLQKLQELAQQGDKNTVLEIDLMMDYTRVVYADLIEIRNRIGLNQPASISPPTAPSQPGAIEKITMYDAAEPAVQAPAKQSALVEISQEDTPFLPPTSPVPVQKSYQPPREHTKTDTDIRNIIGINDKYQFISELFANTKDAYEEVLDEINTLETYQQATNWIDAQVFNQYSWDEENITVQNFYGMLRKFFSMI